MSEPKEVKKHTVLSLNKRITELETQVDRLLRAFGSDQSKSLSKNENHMGNEPALPDNRKMQMGEAMKIQSMKNAIAILPPNLKGEDGRHSILNIGRICGFKPTLDMFDEAYKGIKV